MINRLPYYYRKSEVVKNVYSAIETVLSDLSKKIDDAQRDLFIVTAKNFVKHETDVGISVASADDEVRRQKVLSRLQGNGMLTVEALEELVRSYEPTGCVITEDFKNYTVHINFNKIIGQPAKFNELASAVREVIPAHIAVNYVFVRNNWGNVSAFKWSDVKSRTWNEVLNKEMTE